eukprot:764961-Hanusia_phi.AAC.2
MRKGSSKQIRRSIRDKHMSRGVEARRRGPGGTRAGDEEVRVCSPAEMRRLAVDSMRRISGALEVWRHYRGLRHWEGNVDLLGESL